MSLLTSLLHPGGGLEAELRHARNYIYLKWKHLGILPEMADGAREADVWVSLMNLIRQ